MQPDRPRFEADDLEGAIALSGLSDEEAAFTRELAHNGAALIRLGDEALDLCDGAIADTDHLFEAGRVERVQDGWYRSRAIRRLATLTRIGRMLEAAWGRRPFPFQTLNFQRGSQQHLHSDTLHFSSRPQGFMCGVWIALEDVRRDAGPLVYVRGSHKLPVLTMQGCGVNSPQPRMADYDRYYVPRFAQVLDEAGLAKEEVVIRKGEALVWTANLAHGGAPIRDPASTRRSLVVHYYFEDCVYFTPRLSNEAQDRLALRLPANLETGLVTWPRADGRPIRLPARTVLGALKARVFSRPILG